MTTRVDFVVTPHAGVRVRPKPGGLREVAVLAYPAVLQSMSDTVMHLVDAVIVGRLGTAELGGVGFGAIWLWTALVFFSGGATGVQTFVAQAQGAGAPRSASDWLWQGVWSILPASCLWLGLLALGLESFLSGLAPAQELVEPAVAYARWRLPGGPAAVASWILVAFFRGLGDTRTPLYAALAANLLNIVLSLGLVAGEFGLPAWGVAGAAVATSVANWMMLLLLLLAALRPRISNLYGVRPLQGPRLGSMIRFLRTSLPLGGQALLEMSSFALFTTLIAKMGAAEAAANQAMINLLSLSFMQAAGIAIAAGTLVGRYVGARNEDAVRRTNASAQILGLLMGAVVALLFVAFPDSLLGLFSSSPEVLALGRPLLALGAFFQLVDAVAIIVSGSLRGAGDTRWPFVFQTSAAWFLRLPAVYVVAVWLECGIVGVWGVELVYLMVVLAALSLRFRSGAWQRIEV